MRISDWSSDVCSSDLMHRVAIIAGGAEIGGDAVGEEAFLVHPMRDHLVIAISIARPRPQVFAFAARPLGLIGMFEPAGARQFAGIGAGMIGKRRIPGQRRHARARSEEHTSELQSLMRISYAVFCLKKKKRYRETHQSSK